MNSVHFCSVRFCNQKVSTLLVAGLPFACASQNARSEACRIKDVATTELTRKVGSASRLESFIILPECTREDIGALTPPFAGSDSQCWVKEIHSHYQRRQTLKKTDASLETPSQGVPLVSQAVYLKGTELEEANTQLQARYTALEEELKAESEDEEKENAVVRMGRQDEEPKSMETDAELQAEIRLFEIGYNETGVSDSANVEVSINNDAGKDSEERVGANIGGSFDIPGANEVEKDIEGYTSMSLDSPRVRNVGSNYERGDSAKHKDIGRSCYTSDPTMDALHEADEMTDDFIDFLITTQETQPKGKRSLWSCFRLSQI
ncbi:hypothetical protein F4776DRAFT_667497 [Hypoxylon sp. NC0597]|nr:hypothetical protein F4776DRAFT_667497 [Hypoxylon sp. NC0597]